MGTFQARTEDYVGSIADTTALAEWFTAGAKRLIDLIPPEKLERFSTTLSDTGSGVDVSAHRFIRAHKAGRGAVLIDAGLKAQAVDPTSIYYGTATSPVSYLESTKAYVLPGGGSVIAVAYPTVPYSASSINNFPTEWEQGVILFAAIQAAMGLMNTSITTLSGLSLGAISTTPSAPTDAAYSYSNATLGTYTATTIGDLGTVPTYTKPTISLPSAPSPFSLDVSIVAPTAPNAPAISFTDANGGTYTTTTIGSLGVAPTYTKPTTTFSLTNALTYIDTDEDLDKGLAELNAQNSLLDQYGKDLYNELNEFNASLEEYKLNAQKVIRQSELDQQRILQQANDTKDLNLQNELQTLNAAINDYKLKLELYLGQINSYQAQVNTAVTIYVQGTLGLYQANCNVLLSQYQTDTQNEINEFQKELSIYQSTVQKAIRQAELDQERLMLSASKTTDLNLQNAAQTLNAAIELYKSKMEKYLGQINQYSAEVNKVVNEYQIKVQQAQTVIDKYQTLITQLQNEYKVFLETIR